MVSGEAPVDPSGGGINLRNGTGNSKKTVAYFYDSDVGNYAYTAGHPMKPHRIRVAHSLIMNYGCYKKMEIYRAKPATKFEMTQFHTDEYVDFLQKVTPDNIETFTKEQSKYNVGDDCPVFDGLFEFCGISAGGSMEGAARLNRKKCDIAINWAGGLHHAKKSEASGFCYINDIVLGIIELLRFHQRVLYIDIDVHHGDGVEEAFYTTDRVMTVSFHKYGEYFPGTGELRDIGIGSGKHHSVNYPLRDGITDETYKSIFEPVISQIMETYAPEAVVLQCGGDSLSGDRLGCFNLSMRGHANCVNFVKSFNVPTLVLGGGGYTMRNVARTWAYETGQLLGIEMPATLPYTEYYEYFCPDYELDVRSSNMDNLNSKEYLDKVTKSVLENIRRTGKPGNEHIDIPRDTMSEDEAAADDEDADQNPDERNTLRQLDQRIVRDDEFYDSDEEGQGFNGPIRKRKRLNITDFPNPNADIGAGDEDILMTGANGNLDEADDEQNGDIDDIASELSKTPGASATASGKVSRKATPPADAPGQDEDVDEMDIDDTEDLQSAEEKTTDQTDIDIDIDTTTDIPTNTNADPSTSTPNPAESTTIPSPPKSPLLETAQGDAIPDAVPQSSKEAVDDADIDMKMPTEVIEAEADGETADADADTNPAESVTKIGDSLGSRQPSAVPSVTTGKKSASAEPEQLPAGTNVDDKTEGKDKEG